MLTTKSDVKKLKKIMLCGILLLAASFAGGCNLLINNDVECQTARDTAKKFYSIHFDSELNFSRAKVESLRQFLLPELAEMLARNAEREEAMQSYLTEYHDPLTLSAEPPRAFRIGECRILPEDANSADIEISIYWRNGDGDAIERRIHLKLHNEKDGWRVKNITDGDVELKKIFENK